MNRVGPYVTRHENLFAPTRKAMHLLRNTERPSRNHYSRWIAVSVTYSECVFVALIIQHAMSMLGIVICSLYGSTVCTPHYLINGAMFGKNVVANKMCFEFFTISV
jgi:hypothetical protein